MKLGDCGLPNVGNKRRCLTLTRAGAQGGHHPF